jgi:uncharacterized protein (TIGR03905 family)
VETFEYTPKGVCSSKIIFNIDNNKVLDAKIIGGCPGNSLGIRSLLKDQEIDYIIDKLDGIKCGFKNTSCPEQIANALKEYKQKRDLE